MISSRNEEVTFKFSVDKYKLNEHKSDLEIVLDGRLPVMNEGDICKLSYKFCIGYFGNIVERFQAIGRLLDDPALFISADLEEVKYGECLFASVLDKLRDIQTQLANRPTDIEPQPHGSSDEEIRRHEGGEDKSGSL